MQPEFFVDRSLGRHSVSAALRAAGWTIVTHYEVYEERDERIPDIEWLEYCAGNHLIVLSKDRRLRYKPDEIGAIRRLRIRAFVLARGNLTASDQARRFVDNQLAICDQLTDEGPFISVVYASSVERIFP